MMKEILDLRITNKLSLAVSLKDDFTKKEEILGKAKVSMPSLRLEAVKNPSGYYNFFNIPASPPDRKLHITSDYYMEEETAFISFPLPTPPDYPVYSVTLKPGPLYPFPSWATLIRGTVEDQYENPHAGAAVQVNIPASTPHPQYTVRTKTTSRGQFVLYFPIWQESVSNQAVDVTLQTGASATENGKIIQCKTTSITVTI